MLKNREIVFEKAEEMAEKYRQKLLAEAEGITLEEEVVEEAVEEFVAEEEVVEEAVEVAEDSTEDSEGEMVGAAAEE